MQYIAGISIAIFLVILLVFKRKDKMDWVLMVWLMVLASHIWLYYLDTSQTISNYGSLTGLSIPLPLLYGPFLYTYTSLLLNSKRKIRSYWLHFLPFIFLNIYLVPFYNLPIDEKLYIFQNEGVGYETFVGINSILIFLSGVIYVAVSYILIHQHRKNIKNKFSQLEGKTLDWLRFLILGLGIIWFFVLLGNNDLIFSGVALFIILIGIFGIQQNNIFSNPKHTNNSEKKESKNIKYQKSGLRDKDKSALIKKLGWLIEDEKPFLNPDLSLDELAQKIDTQPNYLSQVLNEHFKMNFYDFINSKRVDEFCLKMNHPKFKHYKLIEIAYECGFNSKSAFNRNFKRFTKTTPSEFKRRYHRER